jgi:hypothetical protein
MRLSNHIPRVGALVLAAVVAVVAYSVHENRSTGSSPEPAGSVRAEGIDLAESPFPQLAKQERSTDAGASASSPGAAADDASVPTSDARAQAQAGAAYPQLVDSTPSPARRIVLPPQPGAGPLHPRTRLPHQGGQPRDPRNRAIDRELRRLIDDQPAPRRPQLPRGRNEVLPGELEPVAGTPVDGAPAESPRALDPGAAGDPDAGLDDTALGGLDQTDLGEPLDEADNAPPAAAPAPPAVAPAPPAPAPEAPPAAPPAEAPPAAPPPVAAPPAEAPPPASTAPA